MYAHFPDQLILVTRIYGGKINPIRFQHVYRLFERIGRLHTEETPVRVKHQQLRRVTTLWNNVSLVIFGRNRQSVEQAYILIMKIEIVSKKLLERIRKTTVAAVIRPIPIQMRILIRYAIRIICRSSLCIRQQLVCLLNFNELSFSLWMGRFIRMP